MFKVALGVLVTWKSLGSHQAFSQETAVAILIGPTSHVQHVHDPVVTGVGRVGSHIIQKHGPVLDERFG